MIVTAQQGALLQQSTPLLALGLYEDEPLDDALATLLEAGDFRGKAKQTLLLYPHGALPAQRVLLVGMGKRDKASVDTLRQAAARAARRARELSVTEFAMGVPDTSGTSISDTVPLEACVQAMAEGAHLALYTYLRYKSEPTPEETFQVGTFTIVVDEQQEAAQRACDTGTAIASGVQLARDLSNTPGNDLVPAQMAEVAQDIGTRTGLQVTVLGPDELREQGFGGILAVGQGSSNPPRFIVMEHGTASDTHPTICLVGKGITFDTGGISIKPSDKMDEMKRDMSGAAAVLGAMQVVGELQLPLHVVGLISTAENMPDGTAYKPGDIITTLSGHTIEVLNTDAEGRIVLADALFYAQRYKPQAIVDIATLTGAITVVLGPHAAGLFSNDQELAERLQQAGDKSRERLWQLPVWDEYHEMMKSTIADIRNTGQGRAAGSSTAAAFLATFAGDFPWAHLDIAGTAWSDNPTSAYQVKGATGIGVRLFVQLLRDWAQEHA